jgi:hypothetical protein
MGHRCLSRFGLSSAPGDSVTLVGQPELFTAPDGDPCSARLSVTQKGSSSHVHPD